MVKVVDVVGEVLNEWSVKPFFRPLYRYFTRELTILWLKGKGKVRLRSTTIGNAIEYQEELKAKKLRHRIYWHPSGSYITITVTCKNVKDLINAFKILHGLDERIMEAIVKRLSSLDVIYVVR